MLPVVTLGLFLTHEAASTSERPTELRLKGPGVTGVLDKISIVLFMSPNQSPVVWLPGSWNSEPHQRATTAVMGHKALAEYGTDVQATALGTGDLKN